MNRYAAALAALAVGSTIVTSTDGGSASASQNPSPLRPSQAHPVIAGGHVIPSEVGAALGTMPVAPDLPMAGTRVGAASLAGTVLSRGGAQAYGSLAGKALDKPIVGMAPTPDGHGYWLVASDGGIFTFGDAKYYGSTGNQSLTQPVVALSAAPDGSGYWMVEGGQTPQPAARRAPFPPALLSQLASRKGVVSASILDLNTGKSYNYRPGQLGFTASIVKVEILGTLLWHAQKASITLTARQRSLATSMIEDSNNSSATALWDQVGGAPAVAAFDRAIGMRSTTPATAWGLTTTTASDQVTLLAHLVEPNNVLSAASRNYILHLMEGVIPSQAWGVSAGATPATTLALKNGWLPVGKGWTVNSVGWVDGSGRDYLIAVLSSAEPTETAGIRSIQSLARDAWSRLTPG